jgi:Ca-activated chloride channel family protein
MIETNLDYQKVLAERKSKVNLAVKINAPTLVSKERKPVAFSVCLDRSSSMKGLPFTNALKACEGVVRNLRKGDLFSLVTFDDSADTIIPLAPIENKDKAISRIKRLSTRGCTNLGGGWSLARDELVKSDPDLTRRMLLLSDGFVNRGICDHYSLTGMSASGLENNQIRTSCLGFGDQYNEDLLTEMANVSSGNFYDVESPDKLPEVFEAELDGALRISVQNLRVKVSKEDFCYRWVNLPGLKGTRHSDGGIELVVGDLVSEEERSFAIQAHVIPIPLRAGGQELASFEGEKILKLEFKYDLIEENRLISKQEERIIRAAATQDPSELKLNESILPIVSSQRAGRVMRKAIEKLDKNRLNEALKDLEKFVKELNDLNRPELVKDAVSAITSVIRNIHRGWHDTRGRKSASYRSHSLRHRSSKEHWSGDEQDRPSFKEENR